MKRGTLVLTVAAGVAVFLVVLVLYLPAAWFASTLPPQAQCRQLGGSVWHGECLGLSLQGTLLGDVTWNLTPARALAGRLAGDVEIAGAALNARADVDTDFSGAGELRRVTARLQLDPALLPQLPAHQRGSVNADLARVQIAPGPVLRAAEGNVELRDFRQTGAHPLELGSYQVSFDGRTQADGSLVGELRDLGGPFKVEGTVTLTAPNAYLVQGYITGRTATAERVVQEITLGAMPEPSGRSAFSFEGSF